MSGRFERDTQIRENTKRILSELPIWVSNYYYNLAVGSTAASCADYVRKIRRFLQFIDSDTKNIDVALIQQEKITEYLNYTSVKTNPDGTQSPTTYAYRKSIWSCLKGLCDYLTQKKYLAENPMMCIPYPNKSDNVKKILFTAEDVGLLIQTAEEAIENKKGISHMWAIRDKLIILLFLNTGMRRSALSQIDIEDIDFEENTLKIIDKEEQPHIYTLNNLVKTALIEWLECRDIILENKNMRALFISNLKNRLSVKAIEQVVKRLTKEALGFEASPHKLRAAFCSILYEKTRDIEFVRDAVGHADIRTTKGYIIKTYNPKQRASELMDSVLRGEI